MSASILAREPVVLTSWKDIARYMGKGVRTVQRWERDFDLPVRRPRGAASKSAVMANREDLDFWIGCRDSRSCTEAEGPALLSAAHQHYFRSRCRISSQLCTRARSAEETSPISAWLAARSSRAVRIATVSSGARVCGLSAARRDQREAIRTLEYFPALLGLPRNGI